MLTGDGRITYQAPHYFAELGRMNHGFEGVTIVNLYGADTTDPANDYWTAGWALQGFGHLMGQTLIVM